MIYGFSRLSVSGSKLGAGGPAGFECPFETAHLRWEFEHNLASRGRQEPR